MPRTAPTEETGREPWLIRLAQVLLPTHNLFLDLYARAETRRRSTWLLQAAFALLPWLAVPIAYAVALSAEPHELNRVRDFCEAMGWVLAVGSMLHLLCVIYTAHTPREDSLLRMRRRRTTESLLLTPLPRAELVARLAAPRLWQGLTVALLGAPLYVIARAFGACADMDIVGLAALFAVVIVLGVEGSIRRQGPAPELLAGYVDATFNADVMALRRTRGPAAVTSVLAALGVVGLVWMARDSYRAAASGSAYGLAFTLGHLLMHPKRWFGIPLPPVSLLLPWGIALAQGAAYRTAAWLETDPRADLRRLAPWRIGAEIGLFVIGLGFVWPLAVTRGELRPLVGPGPPDLRGGLEGLLSLFVALAVVSGVADRPRRADSPQRRSRHLLARARDLAALMSLPLLALLLGCLLSWTAPLDVRPVHVARVVSLGLGLVVALRGLRAAEAQVGRRLGRARALAAVAFGACLVAHTFSLCLARTPLHAWSAIFNPLIAILAATDWYPHTRAALMSAGFPLADFPPWTAFALGQLAVGAAGFALAEALSRRAGPAEAAAPPGPVLLPAAVTQEVHRPPPAEPPAAPAELSESPATAEALAGAPAARGRSRAEPRPRAWPLDTWLRGQWNRFTTRLDNAVCMRETRAAAHRPRRYGRTPAAVGLAVGLGILALAVLSLVFEESTGRVTLGDIPARGIFVECTCLVFAGTLAGIMALITMADAFVRERDQGTLGQLLSTRLTTWEIIWGKLLAGLWSLVPLLLGVLPVTILGALTALSWRFALPALFVGVLAWCTGAWCLGCWAMALSAVTKRSGDAGALAFLIVGLAYAACVSTLGLLGAWERPLLLAAHGLSANAALFGHGCLGLFATHLLLDWRRRGDLEITPDQEHPT